MNDPILRCSKTGFALTWSEILAQAEELVLDDDRPWKPFKDALKIEGQKNAGQGG